MGKFFAGVCACDMARSCSKCIITSGRTIQARVVQQTRCNNNLTIIWSSYQIYLLGMTKTVMQHIWERRRKVFAGIYIKITCITYTSRCALTPNTSNETITGQRRMTKILRLMWFYNERFQSTKFKCDVFSTIILTLLQIKATVLCCNLAKYSLGTEIFCHLLIMTLMDGTSNKVRFTLNYGICAGCILL